VLACAKSVASGRRELAVFAPREASHHPRFERQGGYHPSNCIEPLSAHLDELRLKSRVDQGSAARNDLSTIMRKNHRIASLFTRLVPLDGDDTIASATPPAPPACRKRDLDAGGDAGKHRPFGYSTSVFDIRMFTSWPAPIAGAPILFKYVGVINGMTTAVVAEISPRDKFSGTSRAAPRDRGGRRRSDRGP